jgi:hypothetical protein
VEDLAEFYKKGEHSVIVLSDTQELQKLKAAEEKTQSYMSALLLENKTQENKINNLQLKFEELQHHYEELEGISPICSLTAVRKNGSIRI